MKPIKTATWALANGYTHHGRLHGIPVWLGNPDDDLWGPSVCAKNWMFEIALDISEAIFGTLVYLGLRDLVYAIAVGDEIRVSPNA